MYDNSFLSSNYIIQKINVNLGIDFTSTKTFSYLKEQNESLMK